MASRDDPPLGAVSAAVYTVPCDEPEGDGTLAWDSTTVVVVHVEAGGERGTGWTYGSAAVKDVVESSFAPLLAGGDPMAVPELHERLHRSMRNDGRPGIVSHALSAVDTALWDLKAKLVGLPLADLLGRARDEVPVYGSGGFTTYDEATTRRQVRGWMEAGLDKVKIKIGESWGTRVDRDLARVALVRRLVGDGVEVFVDANGAYRRKQAVRVSQELVERYGVTWFEEPVSSNDLPGLREVRDQAALDVAAGEYGYLPSYYVGMAESVDCLQADVTRVGGYTDWMVVAHMAGAHELTVSGHCAPALTAPVALAVTNVRHLEWFHDHVRIERLLFDGVPEPVGGMLRPSDAPGHGMALKAADAERYRTR